MVLYFQMKDKAKSYICLLCNFLGFIENTTVHIYKTHTNTASPLQCRCGFIAVKEAALKRHQTKKGCNGTGPIPTSKVPLNLMMREASQSERKRHLRRKAHGTQSFVLQDEGLDYHDWEVTDTNPEMSWTQQHHKMTTLEEENTEMKKKLEEMKRINELLSAELVEPACGVPYSSALSGFEAAWEEEKSNTASSLLFPDPPQRIPCSVVVPEAGRRLSQSERVWKRSSEDAIRSYNKKHRKR